jgi:eukaryotic-like serine/threonine-protein kinase
VDRHGTGQGRSLDRVISEDGPLPPRRAAELGSTLIGALTSAHSAGVLHRDVKPSNVLVDTDGRVVLTDFGIATFAGDPSQTLTGMVVGTPGFTAPERVRGEGATTASDLWSLGATLYAAVEGRGPFDRAGGADAVTLGVAKEDAPRAPSAGPLGQVIDALLRRDPAARPDTATAAQLLAAAAAATVALPSVAAVLAPPVFAELSMPKLPALADDRGMFASPDSSADMTAVTDRNATADVGGDASAAGPAGQHAGGADGDPVLWQPLKQALGRTSARGAVASDPSPARAVGGPEPGRTGSGDGFLSGRQDAPGHNRRGLLIGVGIAAIGAAIIVGWYLYHSAQTIQAVQRLTAPAIATRGTAGPGNHGGASSGAGVNPSSSAPVPGASAPTVSSKSQPGDGQPSAGTSASPGASSSPSPSPKGPVLPPGYVWHRFTAAVMGTAAGFEIGMPSAWQQSVAALSAHLNQPASNFHLTVNLAPWTLTGPLAQAEHLANLAARTDAGYRQLALGLIGFKTVGGYTAAPAAELKFRWTKLSEGSVTDLVILVTLATKAGPQPYMFTLTAPTATFASASSIFYTAMPTFRPLPG